MNKTPEEGFERSRDRIEIDVTYKCNKRCNNCNRSCSQAPTHDSMTVEQIKKFVNESIKNDVKWEYIRVLGGEPTLHPDIFEIINLLLSYKNNYLPQTSIMLVTNGCGKIVKEVLSKVPKEVIIEDSSKKIGSNTYKMSDMLKVMCADMPIKSEMPFIIFNNAPQDIPWYKEIDYSRGCWLCTIGIGLSPYGYYPCPIAGGIDRIFGFNLGRKKLPKQEDGMKDQFKVFCRLCGHFRPYKQVVSPTWKKAYDKYKTRKSSLSLY